MDLVAWRGTAGDRTPAAIVTAGQLELFTMQSATLFHQSGRRSPVLDSSVLGSEIFVDVLTAETSWSFERGLSGWTATGDAFDAQPTCGHTVAVERAGWRPPLGGDYWSGIPVDVGHVGRYWIGTYERRPRPDDPAGRIQGDGPRGTLVSSPFRIGERTRYISFLIGGGGDIATERVELQITEQDVQRVREHEARSAEYARVALAAGQPVRIQTADLPATPRRDEDWVVVREATGRFEELMFRHTWDVAGLVGATARIRVVDQSSGPWGHINCDDFRFWETPYA
jgi:hypothetical protein